MSMDETAKRPKARVAKGFRDIGPDELRGVKRMLRTIEQPFVEYTDALGKFLPDQDRPNAGVFSFQDDDDQWLSLRYDLTAPLARYVAENQQSLAMPYRSYRQGWVFRNEKPGPGRYRQFMQFDADTVGTASPAADAEVCMMAADTMEALGIARGSYVMKINSRKLLDGFVETYAIPTEVRLTWLRALDKLDRLGNAGVADLLGKGRKDESGDFTKGAGLDARQIEASLAFATASELDSRMVSGSAVGEAALADIKAMTSLFAAAGYGADRIRYDASVVRGLEYYTGAVFECELLMEARNEEGQLVRFGSVGGGGRYDDLVARFTGQSVPATGFSIGVSRLYSALKLVGKAQETSTLAPVVVLVMDRERAGDYQAMTQALRNAGIRAEMYLGQSGMKAQMKYADRRGSPLVVIQGGDEKARGEVTLKDLKLGAALAQGIALREDYAGQRLAQYAVPEAELVAAVRKALDAG